MVIDTSILIDHLRKLAATALRNNLPIKTLNVRHFARVEGLILV